MTLGMDTNKTAQAWQRAAVRALASDLPHRLRLRGGFVVVPSVSEDGAAYHVALVNGQAGDCDCQAGVTRWNRILERHGLSDRLRLPDRKFNRGIGMFSSLHFDPDGLQLSNEEWARRKHEWLPAPQDREYLLSIMAAPVYEPGKFANYIAPPLRGINRMPIDFEYVRTEA